MTFFHHTGALILYSNVVKTNHQPPFPFLLLDSLEKRMQMRVFDINPFLRSGALCRPYHPITALENNVHTSQGAVLTFFYLFISLCSHTIHPGSNPSISSLVPFLRTPYLPSDSFLTFGVFHPCIVGRFRHESLAFAGRLRALLCLHLRFRCFGALGGCFSFSPRRGLS